ncbi:hypothetical protein L3Y34_012702 [Caenorhabditis briggsae]|uniref:Uncharacterized protein n=1 Tax=Caenorhabditis briggsae TaxID=6238 RepID=A0AAE9CVI5_CAEBR|nr:hypothetical protein L3Y34_012702 [Caenorhabditis briggsae]
MFMIADEDAEQTFHSFPLFLSFETVLGTVLLLSSTSCSITAPEQLQIQTAVLMTHSHLMPGKRLKSIRDQQNFNRSSCLEICVHNRCNDGFQ